MNTGDVEPRRDAGFTLVEMMVAFAIFTVVITLAFGQLSTGMSQTADLDRAAIATSSARFAIDAIVAELRQASTDDAGLEAIEAATVNGITFYSPDRSNPKRLRKIIYRVVGTDLQRSELLSTNAGNPPWTFPGTPSPFRTVLSNLASTSLFTYYTSTGAVATTASSVKTVNVDIQVKSLLPSGINDVYHTGIDIRSRS